MEKYTEFAELVEATSKTLSIDVATFKKDGVKTKVYEGFENFIKTIANIDGKNHYSYEYVIGKQNAR